MVLPARLTVAASAAFVAPSAMAQNATYTFNSIAINGATSVTATAINAEGTVAGDFVSGGTSFGFVQSKAAITILPNLCSSDLCVPLPTSITDNGLVAGRAYIGGEYIPFIWQHRAYLSNVAVKFGFFDCQAPILAINYRGFVAFNTCEGGGESMPVAGPYTAPVAIPVYDFPYVVSVNKQDDVAGVFTQFVGDQAVESIFIYTGGGKLISVLPKGASAATGGFINDRRQVAGTYVDLTGVAHGFIYDHGKYTGFVLPAGSSNMTVQTIGDTGRVAGTFVNAANAQQEIFIYTGKQINTVGGYAPQDTITLALNGRGILLVSDYQKGTGGGYSYRVTCSGAGC